MYAYKATSSTKEKQLEKKLTMEIQAGSLSRFLRLRVRAMPLPLEAMGVQHILRLLSEAYSENLHKQDAPSVLTLGFGV